MKTVKKRRKGTGPEWNANALNLGDKVAHLPTGVVGKLETIIGGREGFQIRVSSSPGNKLRKGTPWIAEHSSQLVPFDEWHGRPPKRPRWETLKAQGPYCDRCLTTWDVFCHCGVCGKDFCGHCVGRFGSDFSGIARAFCDTCLNKLPDEFKRKWDEGHFIQHPHVVSWRDPDPEMNAIARQLAAGKEHT